MKTYQYLILLFFPIVLLTACEKDFLEKKPDQSLVVPFTLADLQLLLDNNLVMNTTPGISVIASDDLYTTAASWQSLSSAIQRNSYIWAKEVYEGELVADWASPYAQVFYANVVLERLAKMKGEGSTSKGYDKVKGTALFFRAHAFYQLAQLFAAPFSPGNASSTAGLILRLDPDINLRPARSTLAESYQQMINDLLLAETLLPLQAQIKTQPSKWAVYALLARLYLTMQDYQKAQDYAAKALQVSSALLDYNNFSASSARPFPVLTASGNPEIIFYANLITYSYTQLSTTMVSPDIYGSYQSNDLRKTLFCNDRGNGVITFKGSYTGASAMFSGLATDELYLIRAECFARSNDVAKAMSELNFLLKTRWKTGFFTPLTASSQAQALQLILQERRKQLITRGLRWTDLRRLNQDPITQVSLTRELNGTSYELLPNSLRYTFALPFDEISEKVEQNPR